MLTELLARADDPSAADDLRRLAADAVLTGVRPRGGAVIRFDQGGLAGIDR
jgi:hypothetical protein